VIAKQKAMGEWRAPTMGVAEMQEGGFSFGAAGYLCEGVEENCELEEVVATVAW
jgi:hypothetical protein